MQAAAGISSSVCTSAMQKSTTQCVRSPFTGHSLAAPAPVSAVAARTSATATGCFTAGHSDADASAPHGLQRFPRLLPWVAPITIRAVAYSFYIYYRVDPARAGACEPRVRELMALVQKITGVKGRLLTKRGEANLWMEVYEGVSDDSRFEWELADAAGKLRIQDYLLPGTTRHVECFRDV